MKFRSPGDPIVLTKELAEMRDELTPKQIAFAEHLVAQENRKTATECAILAGYAENSARITASKLQSPKEFPKVHAYIRALQEDLWNKYKISPATHMRRLHEIGLRAENPTTNDVNDFVVSIISALIFVFFLRKFKVLDGLKRFRKLRGTFPPKIL